MATSRQEEIFESFKTKSCVKQNVYAQTQIVFNGVKEALQQMAEAFQNQISSVDERVEVEYKSTGDFEAEIKFGGDVLIFHMHTNVFSFPQDHFLWKTSYLEEDEMRAYCGVINIYNFLSDSFKYNRENDLGYLVSRIFVNKDNHYFVEGRKNLGVLHNDFINTEISPERIKMILEEAVEYSLSFDLLTPPFQQVQLVTVDQMKALSNNHKLRTGKRLGFKFSWENDPSKEKS